jgi:hypothetical protein
MKMQRVNLSRYSDGVVHWDSSEKTLEMCPREMASPTWCSSRENLGLSPRIAPSARIGSLSRGGPLVRLDPRLGWDPSARDTSSGVWTVHAL